MKILTAKTKNLVFRLTMCSLRFVESRYYGVSLVWCGFTVNRVHQLVMSNIGVHWYVEDSFPLSDTHHSVPPEYFWVEEPEERVSQDVR